MAMYPKMAFCMKRISSIFSAAFSALGLMSLAGCVEQIPPVIEDLELSSALTPSEAFANVSAVDGNTVTFTWTNSNAATEYLLQIYQFESDEQTRPALEDITEELLAEMVPEEVKVSPSESGTSTSVSVELEREFSYYARVRAQNPELNPSKWAVFPYPIDTYSVMDPVEALNLVDRTSNAITVSWTLAADDVDGITEIRVSPNPDDSESAFKAYPVETGVSECKVDGLKPSTRYTVAVHYKSANRGEVKVWTRPDTEGATTVSSEDALRQALLEAADFPTPPLKIVVAYNGGQPYDMGSMPVLGPLEISGEQTLDGASPVILGCFDMQVPGSTYSYTEDSSDPLNPVTGTIEDILGATSLKVEALSLDGNGYEYGSLISFGAAFPTESVVEVSVKNNEISGYAKGVFSIDNASKTVNFGEIRFESNIISDTQGSGGDGFDIRSNNTIGSIVFRNNTVTDGMRTFFRIDAGTIGSFEFSGNTVNNLSFGTSNNDGLLKLGNGPKGDEGDAARTVTVTGTYILKDNLFLNNNNSESNTVLFSSKCTALPTEVSGNFFYNNSPKFFYTGESGEKANKEFLQEDAIADGGAMLSADPCYDSEKGIFNVTSQAVLAAEAGDPRWLEAYVPEPDKPLEPAEYGAYWNLTDTDTFDDVISASCVRGNLKFIVKSSPINVTGSGFEFTAEPTFDFNGVPDDCAVAFLVDGPGSVILSSIASESGSDNDHITVALGSEDGSSIEVHGAAYAGEEGAKIAFPSIMNGERHLVYLYGCGPIVMTQLSWVEDTNTGEAPVLETPSNFVFSCGEPVADDTFEGDVTLTWDAVPYAGSYTVTVTGPDGVPAESSVTEPSFALTPSSMTPGDYIITVQAIPAETDLSREPSEVSEPVTFTVKETLKINYVEKTWGGTDFEYLFNTKSAGSKDTEVTEDFVYNNLYYLNGGGKCKFGEDTNAAGEKAYRYQFGGTGSTTKQALQFLVSGNGTLTIEAASSGSSDRYVGVSVGETLIVGETELMVPGTKEVKIFTVPVTANAGDRISVYSLGSGINVFSITWTPESGGEIYDPEAINEEYHADFSDATKFPAGDYEEAKLVDKISYVGGSGKKITFDPESKRVKFNGGPDLDENGIPENRYASFKITSPGTVYHYLRSSSGSDGKRNVTILLAKTVGGVLETVELYSGMAPTGNGDAMELEVTADNLAGADGAATIYFFNDQSKVPDNPEGKALNIYQLGFKPAE